MNKTIKKFWCESFGHLSMVFTDNGLLVKHQCLLCGFWIQSFSGNRKLTFRKLKITGRKKKK